MMNPSESEEPINGVDVSGLYEESEEIFEDRDGGLRWG